MLSENDYEYSKTGDVYALAMIAFEVLTVKYPFKNVGYSYFWDKQTFSKISEKLKKDFENKYPQIQQNSEDPRNVDTIRPSIFQQNQQNLEDSREYDSKNSQNQQNTKKLRIFGEISITQTTNPNKESKSLNINQCNVLNANIQSNQPFFVFNFFIIIFCALQRLPK